MPLRAWGKSGAVLLLGLAWSSRGHAFCRTTTCDTCMQPPGQCIMEGQPLYWPVTCVNYDVQQNASRQVNLEQASATADIAFQTWSHVACPGSGASPSFTFENLGPVACDKHEYNDQQKTFGGNANIILFRDDNWVESPAAAPGSTLAITTVTFNVNSGEIYDADIEVNSTSDSKISIGTPVPGDAFDLQSILTHEVGHFLGLAHSNLPCGGTGCATMDATYQKGSEDFRTLEADDIAGICTIYPPERSATDNACMPRHGFSSDCGSTGSKGCCTTAPGSKSAGSGEAILSAILGVGLWVARTRQT
jgi:hypothetical protein